MRGIIDYAGLFPPAALDMASTLANYARYRGGPHAWMLSRLIVPAARLDEFERRAADQLPRRAAESGPWRLSVLAAAAGDERLSLDIDRILQFNQAPATRDAVAVVDAIELKAACAEEIDRAIDLVPDAIDLSFEVSIVNDPRGLIAALSGSGAGAKVRTGGVTPDLFPAAEPLAMFIAACAGAGVPFKATAGLHHPLRHESRTVPGAREFGFINVFLGAALALAEQISEHDLARLLDDGDPRNFTFDEDGASWCGLRVGNEDIERSRTQFARSYGSCSFEEPIDDLQSLGLL
jgi:hypothetical protein